MEYQELLDRRVECIADAPPPCQGVCPLDVDIKEMVEKLRIGLFGAAYKVFVRSAILPGVVCHICGEPCKNACPRGSLDKGISVRKMEQYCWKGNHAKASPSYYSPPKKRRILVIGGGPAGIACGVKLAEHRYPVELAEEKERLGGRLWDISREQLPEEVLKEDLLRLGTMKHLEIAVNTHREIPLEVPEGYDAVYIADGRGRKQEIRGIFAAAPCDDVLEDIRQGINAAYQIEEYMKIGKNLPPKPKKAVCFSPDLREIPPQSGPDLEKEWEGKR